MNLEISQTSKKYYGASYRLSKIMQKKKKTNEVPEKCGVYFIRDKIRSNVLPEFHSVLHLEFPFKKISSSA